MLKQTIQDCLHEIHVQYLYLNTINSL